MRYFLVARVLVLVDSFIHTVMDIGLIKEQS